MPCGHDLVYAQPATPAPRKKKIDGAFVPELGAGRPLLLADDGSTGAHNETRLRQQPFELAAQQRLRRFFIEEDRKLEARRTGIEYKQSVGHESRLKALRPRVCHSSLVTGHSTLSPR
jgi:hypothetical protein